jgi:hypothetical protein
VSFDEPIPLRRIDRQNLIAKIAGRIMQHAASVRIRAIALENPPVR